MALSDLDFSQSRAALARMNQVLGYQLSSKIRTEGQARNMMLQDKLIKERQMDQATLQSQLEDMKSKNTVRENYLKAMADAMKMPGIGYIQTLVNMGNDPNAPAEYGETIKKAIETYTGVVQGLAELAGKVQKGEATPDDYTYAIQLGPDNFVNMVKESGANIRSIREAGVQQAKTGVESEKNRLTAMGLDAKSLTNILTGQKASVKSAMDFLVGQGVKTDESVPQISIYEGGKSYDPMEPANRAHTLSLLQAYKNKLDSGNMLSDEEAENIATIYGYSERVEGTKAKTTLNPAISPGSPQAPRAGAVSPSLPTRSGDTPASRAEAALKTSRDKRSVVMSQILKLMFGNKAFDSYTADEMSTARQLADEYLNVTYPVEPEPQQ